MNPIRPARTGRPFVGTACFLILATATVRSQVTEDAATELVAAFDTTASNAWRDTGPANRNYLHRLSGGVAFNQVAVPSGAVNIGGQLRDVTAAFLTGAGESIGSYDFPSAGSATFEIWFEITDTGPDQVLFEAGGSGNGIVIGVAGGTLTFFHGSGGSATDEITAPITTGWHQVVGVVTNTNDTTENDSLELFLDGVSVAASAAPVNLNDWAGGNQGGVGMAASSFAAGSSVIFTDPDSGLALPLQGKVAIFRLYNRALTPAEVAETLATGEGPAAPAPDEPLLSAPGPAIETRPGIVADPRFEFDATILADNGPWQRTGAWQLENFTAPPVYSGAPTAVVDPAVPGIIAAHDTSAITVAGATGTSNAYESQNPQWSRGSGTFELWIEANVGPDTGPQLIFECGGAGAGSMFSLSNDQLSFLANGAENTEVLTTLTSGWHQVVGVINNTNDGTANDTIELFIDGVSVVTSAAANLNDWAGGNQAGLGNRGGGTFASGSATFGDLTAEDAPFQGNIAAFRFYNRALTPAEIQQNFGEFQVAREVVVPDPPGVALESITTSGDDVQIDFSFSGAVGVNVHRSFDLQGFESLAGPVSSSPFTDAGVLAGQDRAFYQLELEQTLADFDFGTGPFATVDTLFGITEWERGTPSNVGPTEFPDGQSTVWGTDLDSNYSFDIDTTLRSDPFDLTGIAQARVRFTHWYAIENFDSTVIAGVARLVAASDNTELVELGRFVGASDGWAFEDYEVPEAVLGQSVRLEFQLIADGGALEDFAGWYLQGASVEALPAAP